mmetsp:Transcript_4532/g.9802  ORF Transcript_4532/g.9802 Transcript_4532/m.9802 type:complete len:89 (-) Transcript_4532:127-393(-)
MRSSRTHTRGIPTDSVIGGGRRVSRVMTSRTTHLGEVVHMLSGSQPNRQSRVANTRHAQQQPPLNIATLSADHQPLGIRLATGHQTLD